MGMGQGRFQQEGVSQQSTRNWPRGLVSNPHNLPQQSQERILKIQNIIRESVMSLQSRTLATLLATLSATVGVNASADSSGLTQIPTAQNYCLAAQRVIVRTQLDMDLVVHEDFNRFVKSKAIINGPDGRPQIQQFNWLDTEGQILGISCKLKNTDHLNLTFGAGTAGPDLPCQEMNRQVLGLLNAQLGLSTFSTYRAVIFDPDESLGNPETPGMTGPEWLKPYVLAYAGAANGNQELHIASKGFIVEFSDPRFTKAPERFRGVHYCHFIAPEQLERLLTGSGELPISIGQTPTAEDIATNTGPGAR